MKRITFAVLLIVTIVATTINTFAYTASNVPSYLFDASYYSEKYEDLRKAFGTNKTYIITGVLTAKRKVVLHRLCIIQHIT